MAVSVLKNGALFDVAAMSRADVWAMGVDLGRYGAAVVVHWNGHGWQRIPLPANDGVTAISASGGRLWLLGVKNTKLLPLQWTGRRWRIRNVGLQVLGSELFGSDIAVGSHGDVWIVGDWMDNSHHSWAARWNGRRWNRIAVPSGTRGNAIEGEWLDAVAYAQANDIWALGRASSSRFSGVLVLHWDGARWRLTRDPPAGMFAPNAGYGLATTTQDTWRVGYADEAAHEVSGTWRFLPNPLRRINLFDVTAVGGGTAWAVGNRGGRPDGTGGTAVIERLHCPR
jgi:hypothetical protein